MSTPNDNPNHEDFSDLEPLRYDSLSQQHVNEPPGFSQQFPDQYDLNDFPPPPDSIQDDANFVFDQNEFNNTKGTVDHLNTVLGGMSTNYSELGPDVLLQPESSISADEKQLLLERLYNAPESIQVEFFKPWVNDKGWGDKKKVKAAENQINSEQHTSFEKALKNINDPKVNPTTANAPYLASTSGHGFKNDAIYDNMVYGLPKEEFSKVALINGYSIAIPKAERVNGVLTPTSPVVVRSDRFALRPNDPSSEIAKTFYNSRADDIKNKIPELEKQHDKTKEEVAERVYKIKDKATLYLGQEGSGLNKNIAAAMAGDPRLENSFEAINLGSTKEFKFDEEDPHSNLYLKEQTRNVFGLQSLDDIPPENLPDEQELEQIEAEKIDLVRNLEESNQPFPFDISKIKDLSQDGALDIDPIANNIEAIADSAIDNIDQMQDALTSNLDNSLSGNEDVKNDSSNTSNVNETATKLADDMPSKRNRRKDSLPSTKTDPTAETGAKVPNIKKVPDSNEFLKDTSSKAPKTVSPNQPNLISQSAAKLVELAIKLAKLLIELLRTLLAKLFNKSKQATYSVGAYLDRKNGRDDFQNKMKADEAAENSKNVKMNLDFLNEKGKTYGAANMPVGYPMAGPGDIDASDKVKDHAVHFDKSPLSARSDTLNKKGVASDYINFINENLSNEQAYKPNGERFLSLTSNNEHDAEKYADSILTDGEKSLLILGKQVFDENGEKFDEPKLVVIDMDKVEKVPLTMSDINTLSETIPALDAIEKNTHLVEKSGALPSDYMVNTSQYRDNPKQMLKDYPTLNSVQIPIDREIYNDRIGKIIENKEGHPEIIVGMTSSVSRNGQSIGSAKPKFLVADMDLIQASGTDIPLSSLKDIPLREVDISHFNGNVISNNGISDDLKSKLIDSQMNNINIQKNGLGLEIEDIQTIGRNILKAAKEIPVLALTGQRLLINDARKNSLNQTNLAFTSNAIQQTKENELENQELKDLFDTNPSLKSIASEAGLLELEEAEQPLTGPKMFANQAELRKFRDQLNTNGNDEHTSEKSDSLTTVSDNVIPIRRNSEQKNIDDVTSSLIDAIQESKVLIKTTALNTNLVTRETMRLQDSEITAQEVLNSINNKDQSNRATNDFETQIRSIAIAKSAKTKAVEYSPEQLKALQDSMALTQDNQMFKLAQQVKVMPNSESSSFYNSSAIKPNPDVPGDKEVFRQLIGNEPIQDFKTRIQSGLSQFAPNTEAYRENVEIVKELIQTRINAETALASFKTSELSIKPDQKFDAELNSDQKVTNNIIREKFGNSPLKINDKVMIHNKESNISEPATILGRFVNEINGGQQEKYLVGDTHAAGIVINQRSVDADAVRPLGEKGQLSLMQIKHFEQLNANTQTGLSIESNKPTLRVPQYSSLTAEERITNILQTIQNPEKDPGNAFAVELSDMKEDTDKNISAYFELQRQIKDNPTMKDFEMNVDALLNKEQKKLVYQTIAIEDKKTGLTNYETQINFDALNMVREINLDKPELSSALDFNKILQQSNDTKLQNQIVELGRITRSIANSTAEQESIKLDLASVSVENNKIGLTSNDIQTLSEQVNTNVIENRQILPTLQSSVAQYAPIAKQNLDIDKNQSLNSIPNEIVNDNKEPSFVNRIRDSIKNTAENLFSSFRKNDVVNQQKFDDLSKSVTLANDQEHKVDPKLKQNNDNDSSYGNSL